MTVPVPHDLPLICHPNSRTKAITYFSASTVRDESGLLRFRYVLQGAIDRIVLPSRAAARHTDGLWRHTCFEAFLSAAGTPGYVECNFAPSGAWAMYRFSRYRSGMAALSPTPGTAAAPRITVHADQTRLMIDVRLKLAEFTDGAAFSKAPLRIGLTAVIEDEASGLSYWALRHPHPEGKPDFHHRGGFILNLD